MGAYSKKEELVNWLSHGIAAVASLIAILFLFAKISWHGEIDKWVSVVIYSISLITLYSASAIYHFARSAKLKGIFRIFDHSAIYVKIAGTYTPFLILALQDYYGYELFIAMWGLTALGILFKIFFVNRFNILSTGIYLAMGWFAIVLIQPLYQSLPLEVFSYLLAGGASFTIGVGFYLWDKLPFNHSIWHVFVIGGSVFHFTSIYLYLT